MSPDRPAAVVVLAAGEGTRMKSSIPKVLHQVGGRTLVHHAVLAAEGLEPEHLVVVVGHGRDQVAAHLAEVAPKAGTAVQDQQLGTGHAVGCALEGPAAADRHGRRDLRRRPAAHDRDSPRRCSRPTPPTATPPRSSLPRSTTPPATAGCCALPTGRWPGSSSRRTARPTSSPSREINSGVYAFDAAALRDGARPARHRQRPGRALPHRRRRARAQLPAAGSVRSPPPTAGRSRASTTGCSSPPCTASSTGAPSSAGCSPGPLSSTPRPPGSTPT